jgi:CRP-like cAMP-binding protein
VLEVFRKYISEKGTLPEEAWEMIASVSRFRNLRKHQTILQLGDVWEYNAFVCRGCLRRYSIDAKGKESIIQFSPENWWAGDRESLINGTPAKYTIEAIEDTTVLLIHKDDFDAISQKYPAFNQIIIAILERSMSTFNDRLMDAMSRTAEDKYLDFIRLYPKLAPRLSRQMLASYLGIAPETLSLIRKNTSGK